MVEEDGSNVIQVSRQGEHASLRVVVPNLDPVVIPARHKHRLGLVEIDPSDWSIMFLVSINESSHSIIPQLYRRRM
jgi:hypothetical protein